LKIEGTYEFSAPRDRVWNLLIDPQVVARCLPGCEKMELVGDNLYDATLKIGIGAMKGTFSSHIRMQVIALSSRYQLAVEGKGAIGFLKGGGEIQLEDSDENTRLKYEGDVQIGGLIASVGQRMIQGFAKQPKN
jgi:carbon monoxide dehydrogenase subunit G